MTTDEIIQVLTTFNPRLPREALSEAPEHREELIPLLLDSLDYVAENLETLMEEGPDYYLHVFAMFLLAQFREQRAFPKLVRLLHGDNEELRFVMGDTLTEDYDSILCSTYNGDINLLQELIENDARDEFARIAALKAYTHIVRDGHISRDEMIDYFRHVIHNLKEDDSEGASAVTDAIIDEHIFELLPEVKILYDRDLIDTFMCGDYDDFINFLFNYAYDEHRKKKIHIDDVVAELEDWACYRPKKPPGPEPKPVSPPPAQATKTKKKIGRNDPCPCGSGKKYKKCCLFKEITLEEKTEKEKEEVTSVPKSFGDFGSKLRELYNDRKPYNLLSDYPGLDPAVKEGERKFAEFFGREAVEIDIPVYKALHHRAIPIWIQRNQRRENKERINLLLEAFSLFTQICARDGIDSFEAFDEKYMVHYRAIKWIVHLHDLLEEYRDVIPKEQYAMIESVSQTIERMGNVVEDNSPLRVDRAAEPGV
jgi:hypothetical protein